MSIWNSKVVLLSAMVAVTGCTQIDDYMLGKDNTLKPTPLSPITAKMHLNKDWSVFTGKQGKANDDLRLNPVIHNGIVYTASAEGMVQATNKVNGTIVWSKQLPHHLMSGPSVKNGYIAVATSNSMVMVLNQADGSTLWEKSLSGDSLAKPTIVGQQVFVKTIDGNLYAFQLKTGEKNWAVDHGSPSLILKASSSPVMMDQLVLVGYPDGKLDAVNKQTGQLIWQRNIAFASGGSDVERLVDIDADPIVRGDQVYLASYQGYIGALSVSSGEFIWQKPASVYKNVALIGDTLYYVDSDDVIWARSRTNGQVKWKQEGLKARGLTEPVLIGNRLLLGDKSGFLHGIDTSNGELISRTVIDAPILAAPTVSGSSVYVLTTNGKLSRFSI